MQKASSKASRPQNNSIESRDFSALKNLTKNELKVLRHQVLRSLITSQEVSTQSDLVKLLKKEGFKVTQSSVSRDLEEIGVMKAQGAYALPLAAGAGPVLKALSIRSAGDALIVLKSEPGFASALSAEIDRYALPEVIGTLAGDDTIFIAVSGKSAQTQTLLSLQGLFPESKGTRHE